MFRKIVITILITLIAVYTVGCKHSPKNSENVTNNKSDSVVEIDQASTDLDQKSNVNEDVVDDKPNPPVDSNVDENSTTDSKVINEEIGESTTSEEAESEDVLEEIYHVSDIKLSVYEVSVYPGGTQMPIVTMYPQNAFDKREKWVSSDTSIATVDGIGNIKGVAAGECIVTVTSVDSPSVSATVKVIVKEEAECTYIDGILIVNKSYPLPESYAPGWETEASGPLWEMIAAAKAEGIKLWMSSGYRSYYDQKYIYNNYVKRDGQEKADTYSARPGHSEHQTGLAYDLNDLSIDFGETKEGKWVAENCHKYGFIIRYPKGKEEITGYMYEPWHIRYLGVEKATEVYESGLCLEEFLNITSSYSY